MGFSDNYESSSNSKMSEFRKLLGKGPYLTDMTSAKNVLSVDRKTMMDLFKNLVMDSKALS